VRRSAHDGVVGGESARGCADGDTAVGIGGGAAEQMAKYSLVCATFKVKTIPA
jgi:hypothetical protein